MEENYEMENLPGDKENYFRPIEEENIMTTTLFSNFDDIEKRMKELYETPENYVEEETTFGPDFIYGKSDEAINIKLFFKDVLEIEDSCIDSDFVDHLISNDIIELRLDNEDNYVVKYGDGEFYVTDGFLTDDLGELLRKDIRKEYDKWVKESNKKVLRKSGIITAIGLSIIALVTGLSVGLTRKGNDIVHSAIKWEKLEPAKRKREIIPWTKLKKATGKTLIFTGRYFAVILTVTGSYLVVKKWKK